MNSKIYPLILTALFIAHNAEEYLSFDLLPRLKFSERFLHKKSFLFAIVAISLIVALFAVLNLYYEHPLVHRINLIVLFALALNTIEHAFFSIRYKCLMPGTISALFLIFPFSIFYFVKLFQTGELDLTRFFLYLILSPIAMFITIVISLTVGNFFFSNKPEKGDS